MLGGGFSVPGEKLADPALQRLRDAAEGVGAPSLRIDIVKPSGADQGVHRRGAGAAAVGTSEQPGPSCETERPERPLVGGVGQADAAAVQDEGGDNPALEHVVDRSGHRDVARERLTLASHPDFRLDEERRAQLAAHPEAALRALAIGLGLDAEQGVDPLDRR